MGTYVARMAEGGRVRSTTIFAGSPEAARREAHRFSGVVLSVSENKRAVGRGMSPNERYKFLMSLSKMIRARIPQTEALQHIIQSFDGRIRSAAELALGPAEQGMNLLLVLSNDQRNFPGPVGMLIRAGAETANAHLALKRAADFENETKKAVESSAGTLMSAMGHLLTALVLLAVCKYYILPQMFGAEMMVAMANSGNEVVDRALFSTMADVSFWFTVVILAALSSLFALATVGRRIAPEEADQLILKLPLLRDIVINLDAYVAFLKLGRLVDGGIPLDQALSACGNTSRPGALKADFERAALDARAGGLATGRWAQELKSIPQSDRAALAISLDTSELIDTIDFISEASRDLYLQSLRHIGPIIGSVAVIMVGIAGTVLTIVVTAVPMQMATSLLQ